MQKLSLEQHERQRGLQLALLTVDGELERRVRHLCTAQNRVDDKTRSPYTNCLDLLQCKLSDLGHRVPREPLQVPHQPRYALRRPVQMSLSQPLVWVLQLKLLSLLPWVYLHHI